MPNLIAIVASGQALPPGGEHAEAIAFLCRLASDGWVPKVGPPHVIAGISPVLTMCRAFLLLPTSHLVRLRLASVPRKRLLAAVAILVFSRSYWGAQVHYREVGFDHEALCR